MGIRRCLLAAVAVAGWVAVPAVAEDLRGQATVIDGDTIDIAGARIRLHGIDAPESRQSCSLNGSDWRCGESATLALEHEASGRTVVCKGSKRDRYGRTIAVCFLDGVDLNAMMVRAGYALAYRRYSKDYVGEEDAARTARRGMWRGNFVEPWKWRRGTRTVRIAQR